MASTSKLAVSPQLQPRTRIRSPSPSIAYPHTTTSTSTSTPPRTRQSGRLAKGTRHSSSESKENEPLGKKGIANKDGMSVRVNGKEELDMLNGKGNTGELADGRKETDIASGSTIRVRRAAAMSPGAGKRQLEDSAYNGLPTLPTIGDDDDVILSSGPTSPTSLGRAPPPAPSARASSDPNYGAIAGSGPRKRRASSIKRKLSPGVTPQKAVDWEIPRKAFHSSIGESHSVIICEVIRSDG